jgi:transcriptional regulator with XRE-family HTH domain
METLVSIVGSVGLRQSQLARRLDVNDARISRILNGRENLTLRSLADLGWATGVRFELSVVPLADLTGTPAVDDTPLAQWLTDAPSVEQRIRAAFSDG